MHRGQGIAILGSLTPPGLYAAGVQRLLDAHPGAFYLRTDQTCPSLRAATDEGNPIYAVFTPAGTTQSQVCATVRAAGGNAYGQWLDYTHLKAVSNNSVECVRHALPERRRFRPLVRCKRRFPRHLVAAKLSSWPLPQDATKLFSTIAAFDEIATTFS